MHLTTNERSTLETWAKAIAHDGTTRKRALRATIILAAASSFDSSTIAERLHVQPSTVDKWVRRFVDQRLAGLDDRPRPGAPKRISKAHVADVLERMAEPTPQAARPWSRRMLASATGLSRSSVQRILSAHDLVPHPSTCGQ